MTCVILADRDGTLYPDENFYLGSSKEWKKQIEFFSGVIEGIKLMNNIPDSYFFIGTNQAGVALQGGDFDNLTEERMYEVNNYIVSLLKKAGANISGCFACPYVNSEYAENAIAKGRGINWKYVDDGCIDIKPKIGLIEKALSSIGKKIGDKNLDLFVIGDRASDVLWGLNAGGTGILVPAYKTKELGDVEKVINLLKSQNKSVHICNNFLEASELIFEKYNLNS